MNKGSRAAAPMSKPVEGKKDTSKPAGMSKPVEGKKDTSKPAGPGKVVPSMMPAGRRGNAVKKG